MNAEGLWYPPHPGQFAFASMEPRSDERGRVDAETMAAVSDALQWSRVRMNAEGFRLRRRLRHRL